MADDADNEQPEIIPKPPSHPITTTLLVACFFGAIVCIGFSWAELFGTYMLSAKTPLEPGMDKHSWKEIKDHREGEIDHYGQDFGTAQGAGFQKEAKDEDMRYNVRRELKLLDAQRMEAMTGEAAPGAVPTSTPPAGGDQPPKAGGDAPK